MGIAGVLERLGQAGIKLGMQDGQLQISAPKGALTAELRALLVEHKAELLRLLEQRTADAAAPPIAAVAREGDLPLSPAQQRLWFLDQLDGANAAYIKLVPLRLRGALDVGAVQRAVNAIVRRHEALRCAFVADRGEARVRLVSDLDVALACHDIDAAALEAWIAAEAVRPFALDAPPLLRVTLLRLGADEHALLFAIHHIVSDGWSMGVLVQEFAALYAAFRAGRPSPLPELPLQYLDYAAWQQARLRDGQQARDLAYWREQLAAAPALLDLPTDRPRPVEQGSAGATLDFVLPEPLTRALHALAQREGVSLFMLLQAAFKLVLARISGQDDIAVGTPTANRERAEWEALIGFFVNTVVLRDRVDAALSFSEFLQQVKHTTLQAFRHQTVSFEHLVEALQPPRSLSYTPLFQVMFALQNAPLGELTLPGLEVSLIGAASRSAKFDLSVELEEFSGGVRGLAEYSTDLFEAASIERLVGHYLHVLQQIVAAPTRRLGDYRLATAAECAALVPPLPALPADSRCVHTLVMAQAARTPDACALECGAARLSYAELAGRAAALAAQLRGRGIGAGDRVGVCLGRTPHLPVALLGVLASGAAYVPLDPAYPDERIAYVLDDAGVALLLTESGLVERPWAQRPRLCLDRLDLDRAAADAAPVGGCPDDLAYLIYTSGSTGRPKGVAVAHRSVVAFLEAMARRPGIAAADRLLAVTTLAFDIAVLELLLPLTCGACVILADRDTAADGARLRDLLTASRASLMQATPATWKLLLAAGWRPTPGLRLLTGGEALGRDLARELCRDGVEVWNLYGPTEATVWVCADRVDLDAHWSVAPLGAAIDGTQCLVLDERLQPQPVGAPGELYLRGASLARGYWQRPELDALAFVPDPFATAPGARLYRTGDRVRRRADGRIDFLGRVDQQVKLRGFRIELGEIEHALAAVDGVAEAVVLVREDRPGDAQLVAYVVRKAPCEAAALREALRARLPDYMLPGAFVFVDAMPLTANGKIDRRALPAPDGADDAVAYVAPRTALERDVAEVWGEVLGRERVGVHDDFFASGGHSLLATRVMARLRERRGVELPVKALFEAPTVEQLAQRLATGAAAVSQPPLQPVDRGAPLPLSFAQQRVWFLEQFEGASATYNIPVAIDLHGQLDLPALRSALDDIVARHEALRTSFHEVQGQALQRVHAATPLQVPLLEVPAAAVAEHIARDALQPFDLGSAPLFRAQVLRVAPDHHVLLACVHHIVADGWSLGVLVDELSAGYRARLAGQRAPLPPLAVQYADFAHWQRAWLQGDVLAAEVAHWSRVLADSPSLLPLPTDRPRPPVQSYRGAVHSAVLPLSLLERLRALAQQQGASLYMVLLAAFNVLLARHAGVDDVAVGTSIANRRRPELEALIGFFVNTLVVRTRLDESRPFTELLAQVRESVLDAYAHQDLPFEQLVDALQPVRSLSHAPWFQVMLVLQNMPLGALDLPGLQLQVRDPHIAIAKYDLSLYLTETAQGLRADLEYCTDLFEEATVARLLRHYAALLESIVATPALPLARLSMLPAEERALLADFAAPHAAPDGANDDIHDCLPALFERAAAAFPERVAVSDGARALIFRELHARANRVAQRLVERGAAAETFVGVLLDRGIDMPLAFLAVLKAGAVYVPIDAQLPQARIDAILQDAGIHLVLTRSDFAAALGRHGVDALYLDDGALADTAPCAAPLRRDDPRHLAYAIFTSGSTGRPKGVLVEHRSIVSSFRAFCAQYALREGTRHHLQLAGIGFDVSVADMVRALGSGGRLVICPRDTLLDAAALHALMQSERIDFAEFVPVVLRNLVDHLHRSGQRMAPLAFLSTGSDTWSPQDLARTRRVLAPHTVLANTYGLTEAAVDSTYFDATAVDPAALAVVPIGRPLPGVQARVLDAALQPVPLGVAGELCIGGVTLARGYLADPARTAERFLPDPHASVAGARLYRTGDLARWRADGQLELVGRRDHQVKLRGFRIELGEIEHALRALEAVHDAVVDLAPGPGGQPCLVAWLVPAPAAARDGEAVRRALAAQLPDYMLPAACVFLDAMPLTANGKIDRRRLPAARFDEAPADHYVPPRNATEAALAAIVADVLGLERVGIHDHFFQIGGHSLLATQVVSRVREQLSLDLSIKTLFEKPTVAELALLGVQAPRPGEHPILPAPRDGFLPLSFAQQRLWFLDQLEGGSSTYSMPGAFRLLGRLDVGAMRRAVQALVDRHETLRTTFVQHEGDAVQRIAPRLEFTLPLRAVERGQLDSLVQAFFEAPFDLGRGPLLRLELLRLDAEEHVLLLNMHHIISDAWSVGVLVNELVELYSAEVEGRPTTLAPLAVQYADFSHWQRGWLQGEALERQVSYWRERLADLPPLLELPTDFPRPPVQRYRGRQATFEIPPDLVQRLHALGRSEGATLFMLLLAAYQVLLARHAGQDDVAVGTPIANRVRPELEGLIGFFVNTLVLRSRVGLERPFRELLAELRGHTLSAYEHQDVPFEHLVNELNPERSLSHAPLFQVMFVLQNAPVGRIDLPDLTLLPAEGEVTISKFDLRLDLQEQGDRIAGILEYNTDLFAAATVARLIEHFLRLLQGIVDAPDARVGDLPMLGEAEQALVLHGFNRTAVAHPVDRLIHEQVSDQARRAPHAPAVLFEGRRLDYADFDARANRLARHLRGLGVGPDSVVAVCFERSLEMVLALHAVLRAGGAYLPIDPSYPVDRLDYLLEDAAPRVVLTHAAVASAVRAHLQRHAACVVDLDADAAAWALQSDAALTRAESGLAPQNLAYVIYTSGSTGRPKGTMNTHAGILNRLQWMQSAYPLAAGDRVLQKTPYSFDVSVWEFFWPLMVGATLVVARPDGHRDPAYLRELIAAEGVSTLHFVPSMLQVFLGEPDLPRLVGLRRVFCSGEALPPALARRFLDVLPGCELHNLYGPTEAAVDVSYWPCRRDNLDRGVPIGYPIDNIRLTVLDEALRPVPVGVRGQVYISGIGLARGYLGRADQTAATFLPDPYAGVPGARMYRTGDLARFHADGALEYIRRIDTQVKIRGFRIELGEIEARLVEHHAVQEAVVLAREDRPGDKRLVAYLTLAETSAADDVAALEQVQQWSELYDQTYSAPADAQAADFNLVGWNSSYTREPIPADEMRDWLDGALGRIAALEPRRVLEIGCGTGLILFGVAPGCERYVGTDLSRATVEALQRRLAADAAMAPRTRVLHAQATDLAAIGERGFDTVILNSVVQYFPGIDYLRDVLAGAIELLDGRGQVFIGDVRHHGLLEAFHWSVQLHQAEPHTPLGELKARVAQKVQGESELLVDPAWFAALPRAFPAIARVEVLPKAGRFRNEMSAYRYDVVLHLGAAPPRRAVARVVDWPRDAVAADVLDELLAAAETPFALRGIPNPRVLHDVVTLRLADAGAEDAAALRALVAGEAANGITPGDLAEHCARRGLALRLSWLPGGSSGEYHALIGTPTALTEVDWVPLAAPLPEGVPLHNDPLRARRVAALPAQLSAHLGSSLPEYMVPGAFVFLERFPVTANGKLDRRALPAPEYRAADAYVAPRNALERQLAAVWAEVLRLPRVGATDNFFAVGGHSLLATQVVARLRKALGVELGVRQLFETPTVEGLAAWIAQRGAQADHAPLVRVARGELAPLSYAQQRLWFLDQLEGPSATYNMPAALRLHGRLDVAALRRAVQAIVDRHETLRTVFVEVEGEAMQRIAPHVTIDIPLLDADEARLAAHAEAFAAAVFDLQRGPLLRAELLRLAPDEHVLLTSMHHIISDGWSIGVLVDEFVALYEAACAGRAAALPDLPVQYADFAHWQRERLQGEVASRQLAYWREQLRDLPPLLELPTDRPRPALQTYVGALYGFALPAALAQALRRLCAGEQATLFMGLLAAFQVLLARYAGQDDVAVGTPIANRTHQELEPLIGFFVNTLVLRGRVDGAATFRALLAQARATTLAAYDHQELPFEQLVEALKPERSLSHSPLFQVMFALQNNRRYEVELPDLHVSMVEPDVRVAKFDLSLEFEETGDTVAGTIEYNVDLFDRATVERLARHYVQLLENLLAAPDAPLASVGLLHADERATLLRAARTPAPAVAASAPLHERFAHWARTTPQATALVDGAVHLSYAELDRRANRLAHRLQRAGVRADDIVGVQLAPSADLVVALLAVLKAGAAYLVLDPQLPPLRRAQMLAAAAPRCVLGGDGTDAAALALHADDDVAETCPALPVHPRQRAYVIFTSGSTGVPKGVMVEHAQANALLDGFASVAPADAGGVSVLTPFGFDVSVWELFSALCFGGTAHLIARELVLEPARLADYWQVHGVRTAYLPPALIEPLAAAWEAQPARAVLQRLLVGVEPIPAALLQRLAAVNPQLVVVNGYGPTETAVCATLHVCTAADRGMVPIGRAVPDYAVHLLDAAGQPVPTGVVGEIVIGGAGVSRGYVGDPVLTALRFVPDAYAGVPGARAYRSGDLARRRADDSLQFVGRRDAQIKLRGFRIELGDIETALLAQPGVSRAAVLVHASGAGERRLAAYLVAEAATSADTLREALRARLPDYMVPAAFVFLDALPLTANGKVDRRALPAPPAAEVADHVAPRTPLEQHLAQLFADVLQLPQVSVSASFFELGGHSLLATQLAARVRRQLQAELPVRQVFDTPTVAGLAAWLGDRERRDASPALRRAARDGSLPLSFAQQRLWFLDQLLGASPIYNMPAALRLQGQLDVDALVAGIQAIVDRHEALRTTFVEENGAPVQRIAAALPVRLSRHDVAVGDVEAHARRFAESPFDLAAGPLFRAELLRLADDDHVLLTNMHHIVSDGWSIGVLVDEFVALYSARVAGRDAALPDLPLQYADFALWQREWLQGEELERQVAYWKRELDGLPPLLELPTDRPRPALQSFRGAHHAFALEADLVQALERRARGQGATLFMALLASFQVLLSRHAGQDDIAVGTPIANRTRAELEGLIGFFVNTLVVRTRVDEDRSFDELLAAVRQTTLAAYEHQDVPFEQLVEQLNPQRSLSHTPLFQVMFALQNTPRGAQELPGLRLSPLDGDGDLAKFDLELNLEEAAGGLAARLTYNADLFDASTVRRLAGHWCNLLRGIVAAPGLPLAQVTLLDAAEQHTLLHGWNATAAAYPRDAGLASLFEEQVRRTPDAVAVRHRDVAVTYRALDRRADALARALARRGVARGDLVGVCLRPQPDLAAAMLAILKLGAAYVPLDANAPTERLAFIASDAALVLAVGEGDTLGGRDLGVPCWLLDDGAATGAGDAVPLPPAAGGGDPAYVIYTSGSTGQPKGVRVPQRAVSRLVLNTDYVDLRPGLRMAQVSNVAFDAATFEFWGALLTGGELVILDAQIALDPHELAQAIVAQGIGAMFLTTALFNLVAEQVPQAFAPLQYLLFGGEAVDPRWVRQVLRSGPPRRLLHVYGPTENTTFSTWHAVRELAEDATTVPIGRPLRNSQCLVLDTRRRPVPVGVAGELYVGGDGLAIDYLQREALTRERFVASPFDPAQRLYRTGDKVRWREDGTLEFLARLDDQVKLRGFRIELGEVETALCALPEVGAAVVLVRESPAGDKQLVAWVASEGEASAASLREALRTRLPDYMVPTAFVFLPALPLTANGKVDKRALPEPRLEAATYVAPQTPTEVALAEIWAEVLRLERVGVHDHFFEIGGHSLLATQVVVRVQRRLQAALPVQRLFETPTIHALATYLDLSRDLVRPEAASVPTDREEIEL